MHDCLVTCSGVVLKQYTIRHDSSIVSGPVKFSTVLDQTAIGKAPICFFSKIDFHLITAGPGRVVLKQHPQSSVTAGIGQAIELSTTYLQSSIVSSECLVIKMMNDLIIT